MTVLTPVEYDFIEYNEAETLLFATPDEANWIVVWAKSGEPAEPFRMLFTTSESTARAVWATPIASAMTDYPIQYYASTLDPVGTVCYYTQSASDYCVITIADPGTKSFLRTTSETDATDTFDAITDGWPWMQTPAY